MVFHRQFGKANPRLATRQSKVQAAANRYWQYSTSDLRPISLLDVLEHEPNGVFTGIHFGFTTETQYASGRILALGNGRRLSPVLT
jgi:hypothetical protein